MTVAGTTHKRGVTQPPSRSQHSPDAVSLKSGGELGDEPNSHAAVHVARDRAHSEGFLRETWTYRELLYFLTWRDVKVRFKQTALGVLWAVIQPLFTMVIFTILFGRMANIPSDGVPRPIFYFSALLPWLYLTNTVTTASMSLVSNSNMLTKIYFPRFMLPASVALGGLVDFLIGTVLLIGFVAYYHVPIGWNILLWPVLIAQMIILALGIGLFLSALNVEFRDVKYAVPFAVQVWFFATPVIYPVSFVPGIFRRYLALNPATGLIEAFRHTLAPNVPMRWDVFGISAAITLLGFLAALAFFRRTERTFADTI